MIFNQARVFSRRGWLALEPLQSPQLRCARRLVHQHTHQTSSALPPHSILPTKTLLRSLLIATISTQPLLLTPALSFLTFLSKPRLAIFNVESNPLLHHLLKATLYNHFCAGENGAEVRRTIRGIKDMGFRGVILTYAREVVVDASTEQEVGVGVQGLEEAESRSSSVIDPAIEAWRKGVLETVSMIGQGDFLALKFTGAGPSVTEALKMGMPLPSQMSEALEQICEEAIHQKAAILVDAEQHFVQPGIDKAAIDLMRKYNRNDSAVVYNTYQAYLKSAPTLLQNHLRQARQENFTIGVKLVRGAYMASEPRRLINDTKEETDQMYDYIARELQQFTYQDLGDDRLSFPKVQLFLGTHNRISTLKAYEQQNERAKAGLPLLKTQYGQLLGMADEVSCTLLQLKDRQGTEAPPEVYKCLSWGTLSDCLSYLLRRAVENRDAVARTEAECRALKKEVWRRIRRSLLGG